MNELERKLRERAANLRGSAFNASAQLRYMANDFRGIVFESDDGQLRYSADLDRENFDNDGKISSARIGPYQPDDDGNHDYLVKLSRFDGPHEYEDGTLGTTEESEVVADRHAARQWLEERGFPFEELPSERIDDYKHPDGADPITVDCGDGEIFTCYVIDETDDRWILAKPNRPTNPYYALTVGSSPVELVWLPDENERFDVRNFYRNSH